MSTPTPRHAVLFIAAGLAAGVAFVASAHDAEALFRLPARPPQTPARRPAPIGARTDTRPFFYAIAHMVNTPVAVRWAVKEGVNALEADINFKENGDPEKFYHGGVCDCLCAAPNLPHNVCLPLKGCEATGKPSEVLETVAQQPGVALFILDSKVSKKQSSATQTQAGAKIVAAAEKHLFGKGYRGKLVISAADREAMVYIKSAVNAAARSPNRARIFFTFDQEGASSADAACTLRTLTDELPTRNLVYGTGVSACVPGPETPVIGGALGALGIGKYTEAMSTARNNSARGVISPLVYGWTLDRKESMRKYIQAGANAIFSNVPRDIVAVAREMGLRLATPDSPLPAATSTSVVGYEPCGCDCGFIASAKKVLKSVADAGRKALEWAKTAVASAGRGMKGAYDSVKSWVNGAVASIGRFFGDLWSGISHLVANVKHVFHGKDRCLGEAGTLGDQSGRHAATLVRNNWRPFAQHVAANAKSVPRADRPSKLKPELDRYWSALATEVEQIRRKGVATVRGYFQKGSSKNDGEKRFNARFHAQVRSLQDDRDRGYNDLWRAPDDASSAKAAAEAALRQAEAKVAEGKLLEEAIGWLEKTGLSGLRKCKDGQRSRVYDQIFAAIPPKLVMTTRRTGLLSIPVAKLAPRSDAEKATATLEHCTRLWNALPHEAGAR